MGFLGSSAGKESTWIAEAPVQSLGWEDPLKEGIAARSSNLAWRIPMDRGGWRAIVPGVQRV